MEKILKRINELAKKSKTTGLSEEELKEREYLRKEYVKLFRGNMTEIMDNIYIKDENGKTTKLKKKS